jgi:hypothetical protein
VVLRIECSAKNPARTQSRKPLCTFGKMIFPFISIHIEVKDSHVFATEDSLDNITK